MFTNQLPRWQSGKESTCNAGGARDVGLIHESGMSPGVGNGSPPQCSYLVYPMDGGFRQTTLARGVPIGQTRLSAKIYIYFLNSQIIHNHHLRYLDINISDWFLEDKHSSLTFLPYSIVFHKFVSLFPFPNDYR